MTQSHERSRSRAGLTHGARFAGLVGVAVFLPAAVSLLVNGPRRTVEPPVKAIRTFAGTRTEALELLKYNRTLTLTPAQEAIHRRALSALAAPCCSQYTMATCCCPCNLAKTVWGLSKSLIVQEEAGAEEVRATVQAWTSALNPAAYAGDACFKGRCNQSMVGDACGGMKEENLIM